MVWNQPMILNGGIYIKGRFYKVKQDSDYGDYLKSFLLVRPMSEYWYFILFQSMYRFLE